MGKRPALLLVLATLAIGCGDRKPVPTTATPAQSTAHLADGFTEDGITPVPGYVGPADGDGGLTERTCDRVVRCDTIVLNGGVKVRYQSGQPSNAPQASWASRASCASFNSPLCASKYLAHRPDRTSTEDAV